MYVLMFLVKNDKKDEIRVFFHVLFAIVDKHGRRQSKVQMHQSL